MSFPGLIGKKRGMTQVFSEDGDAIPVTIVELLPLTVTQLKNEQNEGYSAIQVGYQDAKAKHLTQGQQGHLNKNSLPLLRRLKEFRLEESAAGALKAGDTIDPFAEDSILKAGEKITVTGCSIGKGTQGGTKRWGFSRGPMSHGSKSHRIPGSIGPGTTPGRVYKGKKMAGRMGNRKVTVKGLKIFRLLPEKNMALIQGAIPGVEGGFITLKK